jgi:hypothetical protein
MDAKTSLLVLSSFHVCFGAFRDPLEVCKIDLEDCVDERDMMEATELARKALALSMMQDALTACQSFESDLRQLKESFQCWSNLSDQLTHLERLMIKVNKEREDENSAFLFLSIVLGLSSGLNFLTLLVIGLAKYYYCCFACIKAALFSWRQVKLQRRRG